MQLGIRAEHISIVANGDGQTDAIVDVVEYLGADTFILCNCAELGQVTVRVAGDSALSPGDTIGLHFDADQTHFFDSSGNAVDAG